MSETDEAVTEDLTGFAETPGDDQQVEQLTKADSLVDRGVVDALDEGYIAPDNWSPAQGFGNTPAEMAQGETIEQRMTQELPDAELPDPDAEWNPAHEKREVGRTRAGRLVDSNRGIDAEDIEADLVGHDVGIDGGAAAAEEAAVHIIDPADEDEADGAGEADEGSEDDEQ